MLGQGLVVSSQSCEFPSEIQTDVAGQSLKRDWRGEVRDQFTKFTLKVAVHGGVLRVTPTEPRDGPAPFTRHCNRVVLGDRFLVTEEDADRNRRGYTCLRFVVRSAEIVQIWSANVSRTMDPELCSDASLRKDKWLTVDHARLGSTRVPCPLEGGFTIRVFDKVSFCRISMYSLDLRNSLMVSMLGCQLRGRGFRSLSGPKLVRYFCFK